MVMQLHIESNDLLHRGQGDDQATDIPEND